MFYSFCLHNVGTVIYYCTDPCNVFPFNNIFAMSTSIYIFVGLGLSSLSGLLISYIQIQCIQYTLVL